MTPEKTKLCIRIEGVATWASRLMWLVLVGGLGIGFYFYAQEPTNDPASEAIVLAGFYLAWGLFGLKRVLLGWVGILARRAQGTHLISVGMYTNPPETQGWKAVAVSVLVIIMNLIVFIIPGFLLGFVELMFFLR